MASFQPDTLDALELASSAGTKPLRRFAEDAVLLGKGGAGSVYSHKAAPGQALKIYNSTERAAAHAAKVRAMLETPPRAVRTADGTIQIAWPNAMILHRGDFVGFAMPRVDFAHSWTLQQVTQPTQRARRSIPDRLDLRLYAGLNLASVLFSLHEIGHYVIDLKPQNVLVYRDDTGASAAHVALVDCDGFQVRGPNGQRFDAELATAQFLHPEVATQSNGEVSFDVRRINDRARLQDDFALAIILFQLLNDGLHPMMGREAGPSAAPTDLATRLQAGGKYYAYGLAGPAKAMLPDEDSLHHWFDPSLRELFDRAFAGGMQPPTPRDWAVALGRIAAPSGQCPADGDHWKLGPTCGLCAREAARKKAAPAAPVQVALPPSRPSARPRPVPPTPRPVKIRRPRGRWLGRALRWVAVLCVGLMVYGVATQPRVAGKAREVWDRLQFQFNPTDQQKTSFNLARVFLEKRMGNDRTVGQFYQEALAPQMIYHGVQLRRRDVIDALARFDAQWPLRHYVMDLDTADVTCDGLECHVKALVRWETTSPERHAHAAGQSEYTFVVALSGPTPALIEEHERDISHEY